MVKKIVINCNLVPFMRCLPSFTANGELESGIIGTYDNIDVELADSLNSRVLKESTFEEVCNIIKEFSFLKNLNNKTGKSSYLSLLEGDTYYLDIKPNALMKVLFDN